MSEQLDPFRVRMVANEYLSRAVLIRVMLLDPGFAQDARQWIDVIFGAFSASELADGIDPYIVSAIREKYIALLARAEEQARIAIRSGAAPAVPKHKSIRRRIYEWLERG
jgi:hypothetical protein